MNRALWTAIACGAAWATAGRTSAAVVLYDGSAGTAPEAQPWLVYQSLGSATATAGNGGVTLDTTAADGNRAGYGTHDVFGRRKNAALPPLDPAAGYTLSFTLGAVAETHASVDRAGFGVILLGRDRRGVELEFWPGQVWAQSGPAFTHAEANTAFDPTVGAHAYDLAVTGTTYTLSADGAAVLSGPTRDFTSTASLRYTPADFVFLGDDTTSAAASVQLRPASVGVPEPAAVGLRVGVGRRRVR